MESNEQYGSVTVESTNKPQKDLILKKMRSIKLSKSPSLKKKKSSITTRRPKKSHLGDIVVDLPSDVESPSSSQFSTPSQKSSAPTLKRRSSFNKSVKTLARMYSKKQKKPATKISRSTVDSSSSTSKSVKASPRNSEHNSFISTKTKPNLTRKASLRPLRVSTKTKRAPMIHDPGVERDTCSSALKGSKMALSVTHEHGGEVDSEAAMKVCPFSYCSLHGHRHRTAPPLKRLISIRRRLLKNDRIVKSEDRKDKKAHRGVQTHDVVEEEEEFDDLVEAEPIESGNESEEEEDDQEAKTGDSRTVDDSPDETEEIRSKSGSTSEKEKEEKEGKFLFPPRESETDNAVAQRVQLKDQKYVKMWRLMYKHAVKEAPEKRVLSEDERDEAKEEGFVVEEAVDMVQRAFDEILLPEIQDKAEDGKGTKSDSEPKVVVSKSWSALKKIVILKRFVKALDKVKRIRRGTVRYLGSETEPEAERVNLRRSQSSEERKKAEDWMLDYALRQVISKLDPDQQTRVAMLVKAFETVLPLGDDNDEGIKRTFSHSQGTDFLATESHERGREKAFLLRGDRNDILGNKANYPAGNYYSSEAKKSESDNDEEARFRSPLTTGTKSSRGQQGTDFLQEESREKEQLLENKEKGVLSGDQNDSLEDKSSSASTTTTTESAQSYMRLWGFVYMHMMESIPGDSEGQKAESFKVTTRMFPFKVGSENDPKSVLRRIEAIKLIEKAIDDVVLPDNNSQESNSTSPSPPEGQSDEEPNKKKIASQVTSPAGPEEERKPGPGPPEKRASGNWSRLKQKILVRRFIKALNEARKFEPRGPRFLAQEAEAEAERVRLRHQEIDERKNSEEWMVDRALQQAVARLTPDRKKKVHLLVQAFEAVKK